MEILGIGPSELAFIIIIALILLGPRDMQKAGLTIGRWLRRIVTSDGWKLFQQTSREIQTLPNRLVREAALEEMKELQRDLKQSLQVGGSPAAGGPAGTSVPSQGITPAPPPENRILPTADSESKPAGEEKPGA